MKTVAIIQARTTSTRLPAKVLADLEGAPMLERQILRLRRATTLSEITIATTTNDTDVPVVALASRLGLRVFRGSEPDVLDRFSGAAAAFDADVIVRVTADCPLIDGLVLDRVVMARREAAADYASNVLHRTYPRGLDVEVFTRAALERCHRVATSTAAREHVTWFIHRERPDLFRTVGVTAPTDDSDLRWTVDTPEDMAMVRSVYRGLHLTTRDAPYEEILTWVRAHPEVSALNAAVEQKKA